MASDDTQNLKQHVNSNVDFYELLGVQEGAQENEIRSSYRKTARKYHPDKVGASQEALDKFHLLQIAYDVLSDPAIRELYDNARRARQQKSERDKAYEGRRKWMKEDLERRESGAFKRKREEVDAEEQFERELKRLAEDGKRRRKEREEQLRREMEQAEKEDDEVRLDDVSSPKTPAAGPVADIDRSITLRFLQSDATAHIDKSEIIARFERFGPIEEAVLRDKKIKFEGEKHRRPYTTAVLVYKSIVGAHAAVSDFIKVTKDEPKLRVFEAVDWAAGKEPEFIPRSNLSPAQPETTLSNPSPPKPSAEDLVSNGARPQTPTQNGVDVNGLRKVPSFGSFKGTPSGKAGVNSPSMDEITMIRLKNAERRRMEEKIRKEEANAEMTGTEEPTS